MKSSVKIAIATVAVFAGVSAVHPIRAQSLQTPYLMMTEKGKAIPILSSVSTEDSLKSFFGPTNVVRKPVGIGEGETEPGNIVFPSKAYWRASITWKDPKKRDVPSSIRVEDSPSSWRTNSGITTGMTLLQLEALNGKPFKLAGFEWDYGGTVYSWEGGKLEKLLKSKNGKVSVTVRLGAPAGKQSPASLAGDKEFLSSDPRMRKLNPAVYAVMIIAD